MDSAQKLREALRASMRANGDKFKNKDGTMADDSDDSGFPQTSGERRLTDADVNAIVNAMWRRGRSEFYGELGKGLWSAAKAVIVLAVIALAAYGSFKGVK